jgi:hypothetical protein
MKKTLFLCALILMFFRCHSQDYNIYFDFGRDVMRINDVGKLYEVMQKYGGDKKITFNLTGHTDTIGNVRDNIELSKRRVNAVKNYLIKNKIDSTRIRTDFYGENKTVSTDQFYNRRVEIYVNNNKQSDNSYEHFLNTIKPQKEVFEIPSNSDITLEGKKGTVISFPKNAFVSADGRAIEGNVKIELTEFYSITDFFSDKLSTTSNGNLLTSGGMVYLKVMKDTTEITLKKGVDIEIAFPKAYEKRYYTFYGERLADGSINWQSDKRQLAENREQPEDLGATFSDDGSELIVTDERTANERNAKLQYDRISGGFKILNEKEKKEMQKYFDEQERIEKERAKYYNILRSSRLHYINCDEYNRDPSATVINYTVEIENPEMVCMRATLIFKNTNGMLEMLKPAERLCNLTARVPLNEPVSLLVVGLDRDKLFIYHKRVKLEENKTEKITLTEGTCEELSNILKQ